MGAWDLVEYEDKMNVNGTWDFPNGMVYFDASICASGMNSCIGLIF